MASIAGEVQLAVTANLEQLKRDVDNAMSEAGRSAGKKFSDSLAGVSQQLGAAGSKLTRSVTLPVVGAFGVALGRSNEVQKSLREVVTLTGETGAQADATFGEFQAGVAALSAELGVAQNTLTGGLYQALSAGVPRENVFEFLRVSAQAGIAGVTDTETAVDGLTTIINAFGLSTSDTQRVADAMFTAVKGGKTTFEELSSAMFQVAPIAASAGLEFEEILAAVAALTAQGTPTSVAMTQLRAVLAELSKEGTKVSDAFKEASGVGFREFIEQGGTMQEALGILSEVAGPAVSGAFKALNNEASDLAKTFKQRAGISFQQFIADGGELADALALIEDKTGPLSATLADLFGSVEAGGAALALTGTASEKFTAELRAQADAAGATTAAFGEIDKARGFDRLKTSLDNLSISAGDTLLPVVAELIDLIIPWVQAFGQLDDGTKKVILGSLAAAAALGPILIIASKLIMVIRGVSAAFTFLAANPVVLVLAAIAAAAYLIYRNWDSIWPVIQQVGKTIADVAKSIAGWVNDYILRPIQTAFGWIKDNWQILLAVLTGPLGLFILAIRKWGRQVLGAFTAAFRAVWSAVGSVMRTIQRVVESVMSAIRDGIDTALGIIRSAFEIARDVISAAWNSMAGAIDAAGSLIRGVMDVINIGISTMQTVIETAAGIIVGVWEGIRDGVIGAIEAMIGWIGDLIGWFEKAGSGWWGFFENVGYEIGSVFTGNRAAGGPVRRNEPYLVGELGPEIVIPGTAGTVISTAQVAKALSGMGGMGSGGDIYNIEINNPISEPPSLSVQRLQRRQAALAGRTV
jgi:phage-related protein